MSLCIEKVAAMECKYTNDVARCDVDINGTCQLDAGVFLQTTVGAVVHCWDAAIVLDSD